MRMEPFNPRCMMKLCEAGWENKDGILTAKCGAGDTAILRYLEGDLYGLCVVNSSGESEVNQFVNYDMAINFVSSFLN
jgi:hypothetical protein